MVVYRRGAWHGLGRCTCGTPMPDVHCLVSTWTSVADTPKSFLNMQLGLDFRITHQPLLLSMSCHVMRTRICPSVHPSMMGQTSLHTLCHLHAFPPYRMLQYTDRHCMADPSTNPWRSFGLGGPAESIGKLDLALRVKSSLQVGLIESWHLIISFTGKCAFRTNELASWA